MSKIIIVCGGKNTGKTQLIKKLGGTVENITPLSTIDKNIAAVIDLKLNDDEPHTEYLEVHDAYTLCLNGLKEHPKLQVFITLGVKDNGEVVSLNFFELPF